MPGLPLHSAGHREAAVNQPPPAKHPLLRLLRKPFFWALALFLAICGYQAWRIYDYRAAVREAKEAGFIWESYETFDLIRQDWRAALRKETWGTHERMLQRDNVPDLGRYRELIHRLRPTDLRLDGCANVDALKGLNSLHTLYLHRCRGLQNIDVLKELTGLRVLGLDGSSFLKNLDALKSLLKLHHLQLSDCPNLQNLDALKDLPSLEYLSLTGCPHLVNVNVLKGLTRLKTIRYFPIPQISEETMRELKAALPNTNFQSAW